MSAQESSLPPAVSGALPRARAQAERLLTRFRREASRAVGPVLRQGVDVAVAGSGLAVAAPVLLAAAAAIKLTSPGPVFNKQIGVGQHGSPLPIYKLTSTAADDLRVPAQTIPAVVTGKGAY